MKISATKLYISVLILTIAVSSFNLGSSELDSSAMRRLFLSDQRFRDQVSKQIYSLLFSILDKFFAVESSQFGWIQELCYSEERTFKLQHTVCNSLSQDWQEVQRSARVLEGSASL